jgi:hypothetical protein
VFTAVLLRARAPRVPIYLVFPHNKPPRRVSEFVKTVIHYTAADPATSS